jgi:hypothetical protein
LLYLTVTNRADSTGSWTFGSSTFDNSLGEGFYLYDDTDCAGVTLAPADSCLVLVAFAPSVAGAQSATFTPNGPAADSIATATLTGNAIDPDAEIDFSTHDFGPVDINASTPASVPLTLSNNGSGTVHVSDFTLTGLNPDQFDFGYGTCGMEPIALAAGDSCTIDILFGPTTTGDMQAFLNMTTDDGVHDTYQVSLTGNGATQSLHSQQANWFFATRAVGSGASSPGAGTMTFDNDGTIDDSIDAVTITGANASEFSISSDGCTGTLVSLDSCQIAVVFNPTSSGAKSGNLHIAYDGSTQSVDVPFTSNAVLLQLDAVTSSANFADQLAGSAPSASQTLHFSNPGAFATPINSLSLTGADAASFHVASSTCAGSIASHAACTADVQFAPTTAGAKTAALHVVFDSPRGAVDVPLTGTGTSPPADPPAPTPPAPTPTISAIALKPAALKKLATLDFTVGCGPAACALRATTTISFKLNGKAKKFTAQGSASPAAGGTTKLSVNLSKSERKMLPDAKGISASTVFSTAGANSLTLSAKLK